MLYITAQLYGTLFMRLADSVVPNRDRFTCRLRMPAPPHSSVLRFFEGDFRWSWRPAGSGGNFDNDQAIWL